MSRKEAEKSARTKSTPLPTDKKSNAGNGVLTSAFAGEWVRVFEKHRDSIWWVVLAILVTFAVFLMSLVPPKVDLVVGQVAMVDVKATREGIDEFATELLVEKALADVSEVWDSNPKVLEDTQKLYQELLEKIQSLAESDELSTQHIINELRP